MSFEFSFTCWSKRLSHLLILAILQLTIDFFALKLAEENLSVNYFHCERIQFNNFLA